MFIVFFFLVWTLLQVIKDLHLVYTLAFQISQKKALVLPEDTTNSGFCLNLGNYEALFSKGF